MMQLGQINLKDVRQSLRNSTKKLLIWFDHLSKREQILLIITTVLFLLLAWYSLLWTPIKQQRIQTQQTKQTTQQQLSGFQQQIQRIIDHGIQGADVNLMEQQRQLSSQANNLEKQLKQYQRDAVQAAEITNMLQALLQSVPHVKLIRLANTVPDEDDRESQPHPPVNIVAHHLLLELEGDYQSITAYLEKIEQLQWQIFWDSFDYQVQEHPQAKVIIKLHTLSTKHEK